MIKLSHHGVTGSCHELTLGLESAPTSESSSAGILIDCGLFQGQENGDGALGFWKALNKVFPETRHQRCWVQKTANVLDKLPKSVQPKVKLDLHKIYLAEPRDELAAFYRFPAVHWIHLRTTNPIEFTFATVRLRTKRSRSCGNRDTTLSMVFKLLQSAQKRWKRIKGFDQLKLVVNNVQFRDGERVDDQSGRDAA